MTENTRLKIVIAGGGRVGSALAARLVTAKHSVTVIERDRGVCERLFEDVGVVTVCGDATDARSLDTAGIGSADIVAAMLARDSENLAFVLLTRAKTSARVMVRMLDDNYREAYRLAGVRDPIAEAEVIVGKITTAIEFPEVGGAIPLGAGDTILVELEIRKRATVAGKTVAQVRGDPRFPGDCVFIGLVDPSGHTELPTGATLLRADHTLILVTRKDKLATVIEFLTLAPAVEGEAAASVLDGLRRIDFLAPLQDDELAELARAIGLVRKASGEVVLRKGDQDSGFYFVLTGEVAMLGDDESTVLQTVRQGGFFGEISVLTGVPAPATAQATMDSELVAIGRDDFRRVLMANPAVAMEMSRILGQRLAESAKVPAAPRRRRFFSKG